MKNLFNNIHLFVLFLFFNVSGYAQLYPVQLTPVFNSPYSVKISDYVTSMDTKMQLLINPTDISISQRQVRLKLYIQGNGLNVQSSEFIQGQRPIFINGGELQTLTNTDIGALFRLENLQGITAQQYANGLPDGMYNFCFEMYDYITNQKISQKSCASLYLLLNDPPLLNTPQRNEQIASTEFPNIMFTWTPRQINATNISYKFELKQLIDPTLDPQFGFQMSPVLYEETLFGTALLYNLSMPILTPGLRYAWRVRAISTTGLSENAVFKNDGYSEIYSFKYTAACVAPTFLLSEIQGSNSVKVTWQGIPEHTRYQVQYKKQDVKNAQWFSSNSLNTQSLITDLEPGFTYQFRVGSSCDPAADGIQSFTYSGINTFTIPVKTDGVPAYNCGITPQISIQNQTPIINLLVGEVFTAGDFPVKITQLSGSNGQYSGKGTIDVPYLENLKLSVKFDNITINTNYQLIRGIVETAYDPKWGNVINIVDKVNDVAESFNEITDLISGILEKLKELKDDNVISEKEMQAVIVQTSEQKEKIENANKILQDSKNNNTIDKSITENAQKAIVEAAKELEKKEMELIAKSKTSIKFVAFEKSFENKETLATMFTNQDIIIKIVSTDTISKIDLGKLKYFLEKNELTVNQKDKDYFINIKADKTTLKEGKNELKILDESGKNVLSKLIVATYYAPIIEFERGDKFTGEYLFDKGFEQPNLKDNTKYTGFRDKLQYNSFKAGKNQEDYFAPVLGLNIKKEVTLKVNVKSLDNLAEKDPLFKLIIKPQKEGIVEINNTSLQLDFNTLKNLKALYFKSLTPINAKILTPIMIDFYMDVDGTKVAQLEYYCAEKIKKNINLIYTKFSDETTYPTYFTKESLGLYLNNSSMNQLFMDITITEEKYDARFDSKSFLGKSNEQILADLKLGKFGGLTIPIKYNQTLDYYFVTNLIRQLSEEASLGGAHWPGEPGGFHVKITDSAGEKVESLAAHEFGHWVNFPHTFEMNRYVPLNINATKGGSKENYMDYNIKRLSWYKVQLLSSNRKE